MLTNLNELCVFSNSSFSSLCNKLNSFYSLELLLFNFLYTQKDNSLFYLSSDFNSKFVEKNKLTTSLFSSSEAIAEELIQYTSNDNSVVLMEKNILTKQLEVTQNSMVNTYSIIETYFVDQAKSKSYELTVEVKKLENRCFVYVSLDLLSANSKINDSSSIFNKIIKQSFEEKLSLELKNFEETKISHFTVIKIENKCLFDYISNLKYLELNQNILKINKINKDSSNILHFSVSMEGRTFDVEFSRSENIKSSSSFKMRIYDINEDTTYVVNIEASYLNERGVFMHINCVVNKKLSPQKKRKLCK